MTLRAVRAANGSAVLAGAKVAVARSWSVARGVRRLAAAKATSRRAVLPYAPLLRRGVYVADDGRTWRRWRQPVPEHLRRTRPPQHGPRPAPGVTRMVARLARTVRVAAPPVWLVGRGGPTGYSIATSTHDGGLVLLDPSGGRVARVGGGTGVGSDYVALRSRYGAHVPMPAFEVHDGMVVEEFVDGVHFLELSATEQVAAVKVLLGSYTALVRAEGGGSSADRLGDALALVEHSALPPAMRAYVDPPALRHAAASWPLVPSGTDANVKNLIVVSRRTPVPIDLVTVRDDPFFYFPLGIVGNARGPVLQTYLDGGLDGEMHRLFQAAGSRFDASASGRLSLLAARVLVATLHQARREGFGAGSARVGAVLEERWGELRSTAPADWY
ncbi:hypothetical protein [Cellulosimicrobium sp. Marseille-Q4280]|uniref:hypothetical protein n=1 Tax=Cellulosimicrobium sp. Marseille-Q4280 TaxID=2937992 RepID=UPI0020423074|nr:hypothetical protein [Cellulosimicrobium sp. Marseille-Q4280]